jgi:putative tricarboxylic transport membrane protein
MIGLFAFPEMIELSAKGGSIAKDRGKVGLTGTLDGVWASFKYWKTLLRGSLIGTFVGAIPGVGGTVAAFLAYFSTVHASKDPKSFGKGNIEGVIAPEAANNAKDGGNLIPTLAFGIPGTAEMAVLLGVLVLHGMEPGPTMIMHHEAEIYGLILTLTLSSVLASVIGLMMVRPLAMITRLDAHILVPVVIAISFVGAYANDSLAGDIVLAFVFGVIGYLLIRFDYPRLPLVIALVLGELAERSFDQTMMISNGSWSIFLTRPISLLLLVLIVLALTFPTLRTLSRREKTVEQTS